MKSTKWKQSLGIKQLLQFICGIFIVCVCVCVYTYLIEYVCISVYPYQV